MIHFGLFDIDNYQGEKEGYLKKIAVTSSQILHDTLLDSVMRENVVMPYCFQGFLAVFGRFLKGGSLYLCRNSYTQTTFSVLE